MSLLIVMMLFKSCPFIQIRPHSNDALICELKDEMSELKVDIIPQIVLTESLEQMYLWLDDRDDESVIEPPKKKQKTLHKFWNQ